MGAIADDLLAATCATVLDATHGEDVEILTGTDAGKTFRAVIEVETDVELNGELGADPRPKRVARFLAGAVPSLRRQDTIETSDGKIYKAVRRPGAAYLTRDFELIEVTSSDT